MHKNLFRYSLTIVLLASSASISQATQDDEAPQDWLLPKSTFVAARVSATDSDTARFAIMTIANGWSQFGQFGSTSPQLEELLTSLSDSEINDMIFGISSHGEANDMLFVALDSFDRTVNDKLVNYLNKHSQANWKTTLSGKQVFICSPKQAAQIDALDLDQDHHHFLRKALAKPAEGTTLQIVISPSSEHRFAIERTMPTLPENLGGMPTKDVTDGIQWASIELGNHPETLFRTHFELSEVADTSQMLVFVELAIEWLDNQEVISKYAPNTGELAKMLKPIESAGHLEIALTKDELSGGLPQESVNRWQGNIRSLAASKAARQQMKQVAIAMHMHVDSSRDDVFPPFAKADESGRPLLSWRVALLPFLGEEAVKLYGEFNLSEPWDSEHNAKLIPRMPKAFLVGSSLSPENGLSNLRMPAGRGMVGSNPKGTPISDIRDGLSNTVLLLQVPMDKAIEWTKPDRFEPAIAPPFVDLAPLQTPWFHAVLGDGSVPRLKRDMTTTIFQAMLGYDDAVSVDSNDVWYQD